MAMHIDAPVALIVFNRPTLTAQVMDAIRRVQPPILLVIADGPRPDVPTDEERCAQVRDLIDTVDWDCTVQKNYTDANMGLQERVSSGLDWVFDTVESAIVLEDDCVADPTFFRFAAELLQRYRKDDRIMSIAGTNFQFGRLQTEYSYYFSRYVHSWGWATWRRAWRHYDHSMSLWPEVRENKLLADILQDHRAVRYWTRIFERAYAGKINSWAYRWMLAAWLQSGLSILPASNLVSNVGFRSDGAHTKDVSRFGNMATKPLTFPLKHPPYMVRNATADEYTQNTLFKTPNVVERARFRLKRLAERRGRKRSTP